ncbi:MAG: hypothetical protein ACK51D_04085 [Cyclobacteriaceae bacterium]
MGKKYLATVVLVIATVVGAWAQEVGLSFSYFIPRNGYFSTPISPFSVRGVGVDLNDYIALETGFSLYRMAGLNVIDLPFESKKPLVGPNFTVLVPLELVLQFPGEHVKFDIKGGGFVFYGFDQKINYGNFDEAMRDFTGWQLADGQLTGQSKLGFGYHAGIELTWYVARQFGISFEVNYLMGTSRFPLSGNYSGFTGIALETRPIDYADARLDVTGMEVSLGVRWTGK